MRVGEAGGHERFGQAFMPLPRIGVKPRAIMPPGLITRRNSRNPATASGQTCIELIATALSTALSKVSLSNGNLSTEPRRRSARTALDSVRDPSPGLVDHLLRRIMPDMPR